MRQIISRNILHCLRCLLSACLLLAACTPAAAPDEIRIASWNLNNLHHRLDTPLRRDAPARRVEDIEILKRYVARLDADIVALQEVNGPDAAALIFPDAEYQLFFSGRYADDLNRDTGSDHIYTGFAVRRGVFDAISTADYAELSVLTPEGRPVRRGVELVVTRRGRRLALLNVHLKSGCFARNLEDPRSSSCVTLARQRAPLEQWIDRTFVSAVPFVVLGDFNRAFDVHGDQDHLWQEIDDGSPAGLALYRLPFRRQPACWSGTPAHHDHPIDFFVFGPGAWPLVRRDSFRELVYDARDADPEAGMPSDHCPIRVDLDF